MPSQRTWACWRDGPKDNCMLSSKDKSKVLPLKQTKPLQCGRQGAAWLRSSSVGKALVVLGCHEAKDEPAAKTTNRIKGCVSRSTAKEIDYPSLLRTFYIISRRIPEALSPL